MFADRAKIRIISGKGGDYKVEQIAGHKQVLQNGGKVIIIPFVDGCSTTNIVKKIQSQAK